MPIIIGSAPTAPGYYEIITGDIAGLSAASFVVAAATPGFTCSLDVNDHDPGYIDLHVQAVSLSASPNPAVVGQSVNLTAALPGNASGTVTFSDGTADLGTASLSPTACHALQLDGTQGGMTTNLTINPDSDFTISSWVKVDDWAANGNNASVIASFDGTSGGWYPGLGFFSGGDWLVQVGDQDWDTGIPVTRGEWHYVSAVFSDSNVVFYCDGVQSSYNSPGDFGSNTSTMTLGFDACNGCAMGLDGEIEETTVFAAALSADQEATLYNGGLGVYGSAGIPNLVAGYDFHEGQGTVVNDFSEHGYTGTLQPGSLWGDGEVLDQEVSIAATFSVAGTYPITAQYSGDSNYTRARLRSVRSRSY